MHYQEFVLMKMSTKQPKFYAQPMRGLYGTINLPTTDTDYLQLPIDNANV